MMMWRGKKSSSPPQSSSTSSIFHLSWFSKTKKTKKNFDRKPINGEIDLGCKGMQIPTSWKKGKFSGGDDGSDWRLSFGDENLEVGKSRMVLKSVWYDSESENQEFSIPNCQSRWIDDVAEREEALKFNQMVSNIRKLRELPCCENELRRRSEKERKFRNKNGGDMGEKKLDFQKQSNKAKEVNLVLAKSENQRKSVYISTEPQRKTTKHIRKVGAYSPRTAYRIECKIKAIENMKREKKKSEKKLREKPAEERTAFDSFAVVKSSFDPQSDFKKSMVEMITANGITKAQELEELLACYLTLNDDVYHDTIIKVFRQVWFELIQDHLAPAI